jgi:hypothetical protein
MTAIKEAEMAVPAEITDQQQLESTLLSQEEPKDAALSEPDALKIVLGESQPPSVMQDRKDELLKKARADRRKWIELVPLPFASARDPNNFWTQDDRLSRIQSSPACTRLPTVTKVLSELYGMEDHTRTPRQVADRIESLVSTCLFVRDY